ncbi:adenylate/guanylate cyclase domain-containing protein [Sulfitobacter sp. JL08]|uniref:adenylate/guanylate cyclase domain-containing protein n=1 Tax=Sulfitobacter sp. JL08 TaxID=2070369 RepID=UPI001963B751|nr:adenylate/guanylate cyclase domain-containing protein [Sulfitobacter sp. JL08]
METWYPIKFEPDVERDYALRLLQRFMPLGRLGSAIGLVAFTGYLFWDLMLDPGALSKTGPFRAAAALHFAICIGTSFLPIIHTTPRLWTYFMTYTYLGVAILFPLILAQLPGGFIAGVGGLLVGMIFVPAITNGVRQASVVLGSYLFTALLTIALAGGTSFEVVNAMAWTSGGVGFAIGFAYLLDVINRRAYQLERLLEDEKRRSEALLLNILPAEIATRLKAQEEPLADNHDSVSVLFADLAGFTDISRKMSANELVNLLNDLFLRFDAIAEEHGAEKIKTIGDAYMVATGLQGSVADHAEKIADLALGMQQAFSEFRRDNSVDLKLRIGIHSGAVIAGVIGKQKFSYDLWGDTVNVASRMESEGVPDRIQISTETRKLLSDRYQSTPRGEIEIKGHRPRATYLLEGRT